MKYFFVFALQIIFGFNLIAQKTYLTKNWVFTQQNKDNWYPASIPSCVHTDLLKNKLIEDPYYGANEKAVQWVNNTNFTYSSFFDIPQSMLQQQHIELVFEGLDTYATVYINEIFLGNTNNMFKQWKFDIKPFAKYTKNKIRIEFTAAQTVVDSLAKSSIIVPDNNRAFARKAAYQFGWDFAPKLTTCGIWKPVYIDAWSNIKADDILIDITSIDTKTKASTLLVKTLINSDTTTNITYYYAVNFIKNGIKKDLSPYKKYNKKIQIGKNVLIDTLTITNSNLWYPNGLGKPNLYNITFKLNDIIKEKTIGLRTIELIQKPDSISDFVELRKNKGTGFYFKVNGTPTYINGANYVPMDMFPSSVTKERYKSLIESVKEANINMLRIWGGGIYEDDYFYQLCNEAGIMIWQDFMFACNMLPIDTAFAQNIKDEAWYQVQRLQHNPCIALWCGNNEIDEGWHNWGWQKQFNLNNIDSAKLWQAYNNIFKEILPKVVQEQNSTIAYWPSSPSIGWGRKESLIQGDAHYWGVWWGLEPIKTYQNKVPRFMSEYGMQSIPSIQSLIKFSKKTDWDTSSIVMKTHQKHPTGFQNLAKYLQQEKFEKATSFEAFVQQTQDLQAKAYKIAITAHQNAKPYNMGTMLWQLNDPWPGASWSIIDYYGNKKKAYYTVQQLYKK